MAEFKNASIYTDFWSEESVTINSPMRDFYRGKVIFLTGGTGFLGQIYMEKLLRCDVKMIYVLARQKKGKSAKSRLNEIATGAVFTVLQRIDPNYIDRVQAVEGNTRDIKVGLSNDVWMELIENVNIILHAAADVRFDISLLDLSLVNLRGTRELLKLAEQCKHLEMFTYISTAFSHCYRKYIEEKFYDSPLDPEEMIRIAEYYEKHPDKTESFEVLTEMFCSPWPNTYSFSKALSEELMRQYGDRLPIIIIRPSIVISTHEDPIPAWCNNIYGLNGMLVGCGLGFLRIMFFDPSLKGDIICADFVTNSTLAAIWDRCNQLKSIPAKLPAIPEINDFEQTAMNKSTENGNTAIMKPKIYNVTSKDDGVTWGHISDTMRDMYAKYPITKSIWCHLPHTTRYRIMEFFFIIFYHAIAGLLYDSVLKLTNNPRRLMPLYRKTHLFMVKLRYFMTREWRFCNQNIFDVYDRMNENDKIFFPSDVRKYDWDSYAYNYNMGLLRYIGKDSLENFDAARRRMRNFRIAHYFVLAFYYSFLALIYYALGRLFGINNMLSNWYDRLMA